MKKTLGMLLCLHLFWSSVAAAQTFTAKVNRRDVPQGETFLLTLETDDDTTSAAPDLSVLEKDFKIYSVGNAYQSSYINGKAQHSRQWQIVLMPKNSGQIQIPAIKFGKLASQPVELNVSSGSLSELATDKAPQDKIGFAVEADVDNKSPYVQQQINYTFNIYDSGGLYGEAPVFMDSGNGDWIIKSLGEPSVNTKVVNGRSLREIQFKYALFPQKSGLLKTPDIEFQGYYLTKGRQGGDALGDIFNTGFFSMFATRNPVVLRPESIDVDVKPIPAANGGYWWLPASQIELSAKWDDKNPEFRVGEAVSRSVYLKASGVIETQLPDLKFAAIKGIKQYPDKPIAMGSQQDGNIVSIKKFGNVFIPERAGEITIPAMSVDWYNIRTGKFEKATLPETTVNVLPANENVLPSVQPKTELPRQEKTLADTKNDTRTMPVSPAGVSAQRSEKQVVLMVVVAFVAGVMLSCILLAAKNYCGRRINAKTYAKQIKTAAAAENLKELRDCLLQWARLVYKDNAVHNVSDLAKHGISPEFKAQLEILSQALYSGQKSRFAAEKFMCAFKAEQKRQKARKDFIAPLPKLYK